jgi:aspartate/methionine/tyrosine aminotransferase
MALKTAKRAAIPPFIAMEMLRAANERAAAGERVLHLEVGQPDGSAPGPVLEAAAAALTSHRLGYTEALGVPPLRRAIAAHYRQSYGIELDPARVVVTTGSSGAFMLGFLAAFEAGDRVALAAPGYPAYRNILLALDLEPVDIAVGPETHFQPTPELLDAVPGRIDGLILASPSNPTGSMLDRRALSALVDYCRARGIRLVSDEIYHGIVYGGEAVSAAEVSDQAIVVNSFSKYFSMTGWRVGWLVVPTELVRPIERLTQNFFISVPTLSQHAALAAFDCREELDGHVRRYRANRDLLMAGLPAVGLDRLAPAQGAFYLYADIAHLTNDSRDFCKRMLAEAGVATTPGIDFDRARGAGTLRISFAGSTAEMEEAVRRLKAWRRA